MLNELCRIPLEHTLSMMWFLLDISDSSQLCPTANCAQRETFILPDQTSGVWSIISKKHHQYTFVSDFTQSDIFAWWASEMSIWAALGTRSVFTTIRTCGAIFSFDSTALTSSQFMFVRLRVLASLENMFDLLILIPVRLVWTIN